ncbi:MAG TPA: MFS transporter [Lacisediminihabitans sp.]|jgi:MFS family permease|uniref:MFS transporter n=1 Tax=Lacisediminihabitans sp. TaxID=2787631 RepID=UPI002EDA6696
MAAASDPRREPLWTWQFILLLASAVFMYVTTFMLTPTLPLFAQSSGAGTVAVGGLIIAVYTLGSLLPRVLWGGLTDRWGRRPVYLIGALTMTVISPLFIVFAALPAIVGLRFVQGTGFSASSTAASTMAADLAPASRRAEGIGYYTLANTVGMAIGPDLGLRVLQARGSNWLFATSTLAGLAALSIGLFISYEKTRRSHHPIVVSGDTPSAELTAAPQGHGRLLERSVLPTCLVFLFVVAPYGAIMAYIASYGLNRGVGDIGLYFTVFALALFVVRLGVGRVSDRHGHTVVLIPGMAAMIAGLVVLWWADSLPVFLISAVLFGLGYGVVLPVLQAIAYIVCPADRRGAASATLFATADIAYGLGAVVLGLAITYLGYPAAFAGLCLLVVLALVLFLVVLRPRLLARHTTTASPNQEALTT